ncbi:MAG: hypothetical protein ACD_79C01035G0002 [uncultured bacterium]|nr:MAG: hypothetical protein ACD_79C01035G0002 [uncultured bacterium]
MKVLIIGSGGREHALAWKIAQSPKVKKIYVAPGNGGIQGDFECVDVKVTEIDKLLKFATTNKIDLTVVGPEAPLVLGIADIFRDNGLVIFGPDKAGAMLEGSKAFCRSICQQSRVKIAKGKTFTEYNEAKEYIKEQSLPLVVKADGLAAGKGVIIAQSIEEAMNALDMIMLEKSFGEAGAKVIVEEFLNGFEVSILAVCSEKETVLLDPSQDHKRIYDGDKGPNTGGMGAYSPVHAFSDYQKRIVKEEIILPVLTTMADRGIPFRGVLFAGLMVCPNNDIRVLEFNVRFGDPETQAVLPRLDSDLFELLYKSAKGETLKEVKVGWNKNSCVTVVLVSGGYPNDFKKGYEINGLENCKAGDVFVFHAGTELCNRKIVTSGGRVLAVSALGKDVKTAKEKAYSEIKNISFEGMFYRKDISDKNSI